MTHQRRHRQVQGRTVRAGIKIAPVRIDRDAGVATEISRPTPIEAKGVCTVDQKEARIRQEIEDTRAAMTAKIGMIQGRMDETVEETGSTVVNTMNTVLEQVRRVQSIFENVTATAEATIAQVQDTANRTMTVGNPGSELITDIYRRPWVMMGTAVLVGYILGLGNRPFSAERSATAGSASGISPENITASNMAGTSAVTPKRSSATRIYNPTPAPMTNPAGSPHHQS
jgi:hypothetical protein